MARFGLGSISAAAGAAAGVIALAGTLGCSSAAPHSIRPLDLLDSGRPAARSSGRADLPAGAATFAFDAGATEATSTETEALIASLLERRGWRRAGPEETADVRIALAQQGIDRPVVPDGDAQAAANAIPRSGYGGGPASVTIASTGSVSTSPSGTTTSPGFGGYVLNRSGGGRAASYPSSVPAGTAAPIRRLDMELSTPGAATPDWTGTAWGHGYIAGDARLREGMALALAEKIPAAAVPSPERQAADRLGVDFLALGSSSAVLEVEPRSIAARAGWEPGDRILEVDGASVAGLTWSRVATMLAAAEKEPIRVELMRGGERYLTFLVPVSPRRID